MPGSERDASDDEPSTSAAATSSASPALALATQLATTGINYKKGAKEKYAFWETQPVTQFVDSSLEAATDGPIDKPKTVEEVRQDPYKLPDSFEWCTCDLTDATVVHEVYELLSNNYVEDDDNMFRFNYSPAFLRWCLLCPGHRLDWLVGVRVRATRKLVGFISAIPAHVRVNGSAPIAMVEINFLCVHKKLRAKRLAPVLIKEITRRVNLCNIWQAAYTAGVLLPKPVATCRYWHRSLNPKKLIDVGFSRLAPRMTMARTIKLYKLPDVPVTPRLRPMAAADAAQVVGVLNEYLQRYKLTQVFTEDEVKHWFQNIENVVDAYVVTDEAGRVTDLVSFYSLPSSILGHPEHTELKAAYMYYTVPNTVTLKALLQDAMTLARCKGYDVFNALDLMQNSEVIRDLKFGMGDGQLHYYLYNWRLARGACILPQDIGLILM